MWNRRSTCGPLGPRVSPHRIPPYAPKVARQDPNHARLLRFPQMRGLELLRAHFVSYSFDRHTHDAFAIGIIDEGAGTLWCRGRTIALPRGSVLVVPPGEVHTGGQHPDAALVRYRLVYAGTDWLAIAASDSRLVTAPPMLGDLVVHDPVLRAELARLCASLLDPSCSTLEREEGLLAVLGRLIVERDAERTLHAAPVAATRARDYLHAHAASVSNETPSAALVDKSPSQLIRVFRRSFGFTPHAYQTQRRIEIAKHLLAQGGAPGAVAAEAGFADQSHLNLHFKRRVGVTPAAYRRAHFFQDELSAGT